MKNTENTTTLHLVETQIGLLKAEEIFEQMANYAETSTDPLHEVERTLFRSLLRLGQALLQRHGQARAESEARREVTSPSGEVLPYHKQATFTYVSIFGDVEIERGYYWAQGASGGVAPMDEEMSRPKRSYSSLLQQWALRLGVVEPFDGSIAWLEEHLGLRVPKRSVEQVVPEAAQDVRDFYEQEALARTAAPGECLVVSLDGKGVPMIKSELADTTKRLKRGQKAQKKKMALVSTIYTVKVQDRSLSRSEAGHLLDIPAQDKQILAQLEDKQHFPAYLKARAEERGAGQVPTAFLADGQPHLWTLKQEICPTAVEILDFHHAREYLWNAAYTFTAEGSPEAKAWVEEQEGRLLQGKVGKVIGGLRLRLAKGTIGKVQPRETAHKVINYFEKNRSRMQYDQYLKAGFPIGSGAVESACKQLIITRMEGSGMRWSVPSAQAMLDLRAVYLNGDWGRYWDFHRQQEHKRLYGASARPAAQPEIKKRAA